jgi:predicted amidohydrolase YtcJ
MRQSSVISRGLPAVSLVAALVAGCAARPAPHAANAAANAQPPDTIIINTNIVTLAAAPAPATAQAMAITGGVITALGTTAQIEALAGTATTRYTPPPGTTLLPGFIDPHSHMSGIGFYSDRKHWLDVASTNVLFKPSPGEPGCPTPPNSQDCFIPVQNQDDVNARLTAALANVDKNSKTPYLLAFNYDPARLGKSSGCSGVAFQCTSFENGQALAQLNAISPSVPIMVASESGHIVYVNSPALTLLNICGVPGASAKCYQPTTNPAQETQLAILGQLDEDLALYAIGFFQAKLLAADPALVETSLSRAATIYAQHGFTLAQEGAASYGDMELYALRLATAKQRATFPLTMAMIAYDAASNDFNDTISAATKAQKLFGNNPLISVAAVKTFADGSPQGFTAWLDGNYLNVYSPFTNISIFPDQPYQGLPDVDQSDMTTRLAQAHAAGFPMIIHQNGDAAITASLNALAAAPPPPPGKRDVVLHAPMISVAQLQAMNASQVTVSFLMSNIYFWGLPECQQVLGAADTLNMYPAASAIAAGLNVTLHTDSPVTPPAPLFAIWAAARRYAQQPSWYPNLDPATCPPVFVSSSGAGNQTISIEQALRAYTVNAAWQYGMEATRGTLEVNKIADIAMLSANPLDMQNSIDQLSTIQIVGTYSQGRQFLNSAPATNWPVKVPGN